MQQSQSLVGAYLRHVRNRHTVTYNAFLPSRQGEIDVIGVAGHGTAIQVWLIEVAIHLDGLNYGGYEQTVKKITSKVVAAREYADDIYLGCNTDGRVLVAKRAKRLGCALAWCRC